MTIPRSAPLRGPTEDFEREPHAALLRWPSWFLLLWWIVTLGIVTLPSLGSGGTGGSAVESGSLTRTVLVLMFGAVGALMLPEAIKRVDRAGWRFLTFLGAYLGWAALSYVWSDSPQLTIRRLILATLLIVGGFGLGAGYYGRSVRGRAILARDVLVAGVIAGGAAWVSALSSEGVDILAGDWALASPAVAAQRYGYVMLLAALVSIYGRHASLVADPFASRKTQAGVLVGALVTIISLRKRVLLAVSLIATSLLSFVFRRRDARRAMLLRLGVGFLMIAIVVASLGIDIVGTATPIVTRGSEELDVESLNGRVPLWEELVVRASDRPWTGVGYGAFWTPERMDEVQSVVRWPAVVAHNGYLDEVLGTGLLGLVLVVTAWGTALVALARQASRERDAFSLLAAVWVGCYLALNLASTLMHDLFNFPFYSALVVAFAAFSGNPSIHGSSAELSR